MSQAGRSLTSFCRSFSLSASSEAVWDSRSEPARSTKLMMDTVTGARLALSPAAPPDTLASPSESSEASSATPSTAHAQVPGAQPAAGRERS